MEDHRERRRRFGARCHLSSASDSHSRNSSDFRYSQTLEFSTVASDRSISRPLYRHRYDNWETNYGQTFDFSHDRGNERSPVPKYLSNRPKASGQSISAPGSSIISTTASALAGVADAVLGKGFIPPKKQSDFLSKLTKQNTLANRGPGTTLKLHAYASLEDTSAPRITTSVDLSKPPIGSSGWVNMMNKQPGSTRRISLALTDKRLKTETARNVSSPVKSHYALRHRTKPNLLDSSSSTQRTRVQRPAGAALGKRKMNSEGSAAKPIALDSDSEPDGETQRPSDRASSAPNSGDENVNRETRNRALSPDTEEKLPNYELEDPPIDVVAQIRHCDVIIGLFHCIVDLFCQHDRMLMRNIRGKHEDWPFSQFIVLEYEDLQDVRLYNGAETRATVEDTSKTSSSSSCMGNLIEEAAFLAVKLALPEEAYHPVVESFYDPMGADLSKGYMVFRPTKEASGNNVDDMKDILQSHADIHLIEDTDEAKEYLQALIKDPFSLNSCRNSQHDSTEDDRALDSDEQGIDGSMTVLKYPLPPCTTDVVTIIRYDVLRLKPRRYLNDNIIDYYFKRMVLETYRDNTLVQEKVLFLSSHFYSRLRAGKGTTVGTRMENGYKNVSTWLARSNLFNRSIIFIPINKDVHWSLAIILNPGVAGTDPCDEEAFSCIAVLDPLGSYHRKAAIIRNLRAFLRMQWDSSHEQPSDGKAESTAEYEVDRVLTLDVKTPLQENSYDCGVYVLKYADVVLKNCLELGLLSQKNGVISKDVTDTHLEALITSSAFSADDITATRKQIEEDIEHDALAYCKQGRK